MLTHERLAIVDPYGGAQPLYNEAGNLALTVNAEIYNHKLLRSQLKQEHVFKVGIPSVPCLCSVFID